MQQQERSGVSSWKDTDSVETKLLMTSLNVDEAHEGPSPYTATFRGDASTHELQGTKIQCIAEIINSKHIKTI